MYKSKIKNRLHSDLLFIFYLRKLQQMQIEFISHIKTQTS